MHEYSIISALVDQVATRARPHRGARVRRVHVALGELAGVDPELLATAFTTFRERTPCDGAELVIESRAARWVCPRCTAGVPRGGPLRCASCEVPARLDGGDEIILQRIELEMEETGA